MEVKVPETRGAKTKYNFENMEIGETRSFPNVSTNILGNCAKGFAKRKGFDWRFRCYSLQGLTHIVRIK